MGRYLPTLAPAFADAAGVGPGQRVLDVGCGPAASPASWPSGPAPRASRRSTRPSRSCRPAATALTCLVAAWDLAQMQMLRRFWTGVAQALGATRGEVGLLGSREGDLFALLTGPGLDDVHEVTIEAHARYQNFDDWWNPLTLGIGPAGMYLRSLDGERRWTVRDACRRQFTDPDEPFTLNARAWCATGRRPSGTPRVAD